MALWTLVTSSQFSQMTFDNVILRISANWASVNLMRGLPFSYQKRSHFRKFLNWIPMIQAKVGPTRPPWRGVSARPPEKRLKNHYKIHSLGTYHMPCIRPQTWIDPVFLLDLAVYNSVAIICPCAELIWAPTQGDCFYFEVRDHSFKMSACLRVEGCPHVPMV